MKYTFYIILIFFNSIDSVIIPLQLSNPDHQGGSFISSVIEPTIIGCSITGGAKTQFYIIYTMLYMQLISMAIPALILSLGLFVYIWKDRVEKWALFFFNKIPDGRIKDWLKKKSFDITPNMAKYLILLVLITNIFLIFDSISILRIIRRNYQFYE